MGNCKIQQINFIIFIFIYHWIKFCNLYLCILIFIVKNFHRIIKMLNFNNKIDNNNTFIKINN